jgi:hypothetical protein
VAPLDGGESSSVPGPSPSLQPVRRLLTEPEIVTRCRPQITARRHRPGYKGITRAILGLAYHREYRAGDLVRLIDMRRLPAVMLGLPHFPMILCRIPGADVQGDNEPAYPDDVTTERLKELCAEIFAIPSRTYPGDWRRPDLRDAELLARDTTHGVTAALLNLQGRDYGCLVPPPSSGIPPFSVTDQAVTGHLTWFLPIAIPHADDKDSYDWVYATWGRLNVEAAQLTFTRSNGTRVTTEVADDGTYALVATDSAGHVSHKAAYEFSNDDGDVLGTGPALRQ